MKMIWKERTTTYTFELEAGFRVDFVLAIEDEEISAWLYHENYGVKSLMWGEKYHGKLEECKEFRQRVEANLPDYIKGYIEEYFD